MFLEIAWRPPGMDGNDVLELLRSETAAGWRDVPCGIPELAEIGRALSRGVLPPKQLARHFVIHAHHVRLDHPLIGLEQRRGVGRDLVESRQQPFVVELSQRPVHRLGNSGAASSGSSGSNGSQIAAPSRA